MWTSIVIVTSCRNEVRVRRSMIMTPPPSTVSTVRASRLGVRASKSYRYGPANSANWPVDSRPYLQYTHAKGAAQNLEGLRIVAVTDLSGSYEKVKGIVLVDFHSPTFHLLLQLLHAFLAVTELGRKVRHTINKHAQNKALIKMCFMYM